jgi:hypothetical protein
MRVNPSCPNVAYALVRAASRLVSTLRPLTTLLALATIVTAAQTKTWQESDYSDFEKGTLRNLSLRSDGLLTLAPQFHEVFDSSSAYLWALAQDSAGNIYTGGGPTAKLYKISPTGEKQTLAEFDALEIHAIVIGRNNQVFVSTAPDGKVYKVSASGKSEVFYDPKTKYIWALALDSKGNLFVATGDQGEVHRVTPDGKGSVFFRSEESHARSLAVDAQDDVIVGTEPNGLVIRVSPAGEGFVLYEMSKKEVTAVAVAKDGSVYAAGVGTKPAATPSLPPPQVSVPAAAAAPGAGSIVIQRAPAAPPPTFSPSAAVSGGSDVYRIHRDGRPQKVWSHAQDIVYALGFDSQGRSLVGTGNKGAIYRLDKDNLYSVLVTASPTQITNFCAGLDGKTYAATGNVGKVFEIGSHLENEGYIESDVFDAGTFALWGRVTYTAEANGGSVAVSTRTGNLDRPVQNWSHWSSPITSAEGARTTSPPARFVQWKATLHATGSRSPELESVEVAYLPKNIAPRVEAIEFTPANYKFPTPSTPSTAPSTLSLPAIGKSAHSETSSSSESTPSMTYAKGFVGARWAASDENGDGLIFTVHIRGVKETGWKLLKDKVREKYLSWDSTAFPDGEYRLRVTASDLPGNPPDQALTSDRESEVVLIDNTPPRISGLSASRSGGKLNVRWRATDALSVISKAEYSLDGGDWLLVSPTTKLSDSKELDYDLALDNVSAGEHTIAVRVQDEYDNQSAGKTVVRQ